MSDKAFKCELFSSYYRINKPVGWVGVTFTSQQRRKTAKRNGKMCFESEIETRGRQILKKETRTEE